jgi:hypothetical protein
MLFSHQWSSREANEPLATQGKGNHSLIQQLKPDEAISRRQIGRLAVHSSLLVASAVKKASYGDCPASRLLQCAVTRLVVVAEASYMNSKRQMQWFSSSWTRRLMGDSRVIIDGPMRQRQSCAGLLANRIELDRSFSRAGLSGVVPCGELRRRAGHTRVAASSSRSWICARELGDRCPWSNL